MFSKILHLDVVSRDLSQDEKKVMYCCYKLSKFKNDPQVSLKMVKVVILSENSCSFVSCSTCNNSKKFYSRLEINPLIQQPSEES